MHNSVKTELLGVPEEIINKYGAVSEETVERNGNRSKETI